MRIFVIFVRENSCTCSQRLQEHKTFYIKNQIFFAKYNKKQCLNDQGGTWGLLLQRKFFKTENSNYYLKETFIS